jgi:hypothetical protein
LSYAKSAKSYKSISFIIYGDLRCSKAGIDYFSLIGLPVIEEQLREAAEQSGVLNVPDDFLESNFRAECQRLIPDVTDIEPKNIQDAYMFLKENFNLSH